MRNTRGVIMLLIALLVTGFLYAEPVQEAFSLQDAFIRVSREVGPAVVSISTERTEHYQTVYYPFSRFQDDFFEDFFKDFFITGPEKEFKRLGLGSGVIIDKEGYILTNEHVVRNADEIKVTLPDGREFKGELSGSDVYSDLAVVKIDPKGENLPSARLGDSDRVQIGQWAIAIGNPFAFAVKNPEPTITVGVVSALNRSLPRTDKRVREYSGLIQTDAAINPGNSGGPLLNIQGEIIGINVAIFTLSGGSEGIGFAIPINTAKKIMDDLIEGRRVLYGWIGVIIQDIDDSIMDYFGLKSKQGVLLSRIIENGPSDKAGLKPGDIIVSFDEEKVRNTRDLIRMVLKKDIGEKVTVGVVRAGKLYLTEVEIGTRPGEKKAYASTKRYSGEKEVKTPRKWRGIEVSEITAEIAQRFKITSEKGVVVVKVDSFSPAAESGIRPGDVIYEIDRVPIANIRDYIEVIRQVSGDVLVGTYRGYVVIKEKR